MLPYLCAKGWRGDRQRQTVVDVLLKRRIKQNGEIEMKTKHLKFESLEHREVFSASGLCELAEPESAQIDSYRVDEETFDFLRDVYAEQQEVLRSGFMADPELDRDGRLEPWILAAGDIITNNRAEEIDVGMIVIRDVATAMCIRMDESTPR